MWNLQDVARQRIAEATADKSRRHLPRRAPGRLGRPVRKAAPLPRP